MIQGRISYFTLVIFGCFSVASAHALVITYDFTTTDRLSGTILTTLTGPVTGSFDYNNAGPLFSDGGAGPSVYAPAVGNLAGSIQGNSFADSLGAVVVGNDNANKTNDGIIIVWNAAGSGFTGFSLSGFTLVDMRIFWLENQVGSDFLTGETLPSVLPLNLPGVLALDFTDGFENRSYLFYRVVLTPRSVPEPFTLGLLVTGLFGLGFIRRRHNPGSAARRR